MSYRVRVQGSRWAATSLGLVALLAVGCGGGGSGGHPGRSDGFVYLSVDGDSNGLYRIDPSTGAATHLGATGVSSSTCGLTETDDPNLLIGSLPFGIAHVDADGSGFVDTGGNQIAEGLAYDPNTGTYFAILNSDLTTFDPVSGDTLLTLSSAPDDVEGLTYGGPGVLYGITSNTSANGDLYRYLIATDSWVMIANTGVDFVDAGLAWDPDSNWLFAKGSQDDFLYRIDPATGATTIVGSTGVSGGGGLAFVPQ